MKVTIKNSYGLELDVFHVGEDWSIKEILERAEITYIAGADAYDYFFEELFGGNAELGDYYGPGYYKCKSGKYISKNVRFEIEED